MSSLVKIEPGERFAVLTVTSKNDDFNETVVPEPATLGVMLVAGAGLALRRRTTRKGR